MPFVDTRLEGVTSWDGLKSALHLHASTIKKLQATDPNAPATEDEPAGLVAWSKAGITTADARQLWQAFNEQDEGKADATSDTVHSDVADNAPQK